MGYGLGIRINSDVLNAEQQLYSTLQDLHKARYDTLFAGLQLKAAAGELSPTICVRSMRCCRWNPNSEAADGNP